MSGGKEWIRSKTCEELVDHKKKLIYEEIIGDLERQIDRDKLIETYNERLKKLQ